MVAAVSRKCEPGCSLKMCSIDVKESGECENGSNERQRAEEDRNDHMAWSRSKYSGSLFGSEPRTGQCHWLTENKAESLHRPTSYCNVVRCRLSRSTLPVHQAAIMILKALIFDLDGVLADTERLHYLAYRDVLSKYGFNLHATMHEQHWVQEGKSIPEFLALHSIPLDNITLRDLKNNRFIELVEQSDISFKGTKKTIASLFSKYQLAVCTSSDRCSAERILDKLGIRNYFKVIVTASDVKS